MALTDIKNYLDIDARLASGGQPSEDQLREVAAAGYAVVVNLGLLDPKYCLADEAGLVASLGMRYVHIPVRFDAPATSDFATFVTALDACAKERLFVHCAANYRVSTFLALYGELRLGWSRQRADALATTLWQPNDVWAAFAERCRGEWGAGAGA